MNKQLEKHKRFIFLGIIVIALGVTFSTTMKDTVRPIGTVFFVAGGLLFILGMRMKQKHDKENNE